MPRTPELPFLRQRSPSRDRSRGQVAVIFALSIVLFVALCAVVVDIAFYWVTTLKVQRAADSAALAGAVYLPGDKTTAYAEARASATQNQYTGGGGIIVTPVQDSGDPRQLDVTISASSPAFFSRVLGITSFPVTRSSKGVYVLPVPMGSPLAYYGVGDFSANETTTTRNDYTNVSVPGYTSNAAPPTNWGTPNNGWATGTSSYATASSNGLSQIWSLLKIPAITGSALDGFAVSFNAKVSTAAAACQVKAEVSWNSGTTWNNASPALTTATLTTANSVNYTLGSQTSLAVWGNNHTWVSGDFASSKLQVRLTYLKGASCGNLSLNTMLVTVYSHTTTSTTTTKTTKGVSDGATFLPSQGAFGAVLTKGGNEENGDAYAPANNGGSANAKYDPLGYHYAITLPSGGTLKVFDPGFCAMGSNGAGGSLGAGDHWIGSTGTPVSTYYTLWDANGKLGLPGAWDEVYTSGTLFEDQKGYDPNNMGPNGTGSAPGGATSGCDANHNAWWTIPGTPIGAGTYVLQVQTTKTSHPIGGLGANADSSKNSGTNAENMWSIEAVGSGAQVYGNGRMAVYNNLPYDAAVGGTQTQQFYLAKIDQQTGAGKTALIDLFDPGDLASGATGTLRVFSPDGGTAHAVNFSYTTDSNCSPKSGTSPCSGTNVGSITTTSPSGQATNNTWIHISIPLGTSYGQAGLWQGGWWQIQYTIDKGGNDTTTWEVSVSGNPVHLLIP